MDDGDTSDSMEYPSDDETSEYMRQLLKRKRRMLRQFEKENGALTKLSDILPTKTESFPASKPKSPVKRKRASVPAFGARRKSARQSGAQPTYAEMDFEEPVLKRRKTFSATPRVFLGRTKTIDFNPEGVDFNKIHYSSCKKVYSQSGTSCHQCRQKTIDVKSHCRNCGTARGQFCGFCLWKRYGENVVDALQNPKWKCPPCRNICNCSICRRRRGKAPTGQLVPLVSAQGFNSVAEYLQEVGDTVIIDDDDDNDDNQENGFLAKKDSVSDETNLETNGENETAADDTLPGIDKPKRQSLNTPTAGRKTPKRKSIPSETPARTNSIPGGIRIKEEPISDEESAYEENSCSSPPGKLVVKIPRRIPLRNILASSHTMINLDAQVDSALYQPFIKLEKIDVDG